LGVIWELSTPKSISFIWGLGRLLGLILTVQIFSGLILSFYYSSGIEAWNSVIILRREVRLGWVIRLFHRNGASFIFLVLFLHLLRGLYFNSFALMNVWFSGYLLIVLCIGTAFLGYVLPWGQMSFWGATVIINLVSILPYGKNLVVWLWGGFYVSYLTCRFFFTIHFLLPFLIVILIMFHLTALHLRGRSSFRGIRNSSAVKFKFQELFLFKDLVNVVLIWLALIISLIYPDWLSDPVNFIISDLSTSPMHIQPEWYFLNLYGILRSIPNKLGGLIAFTAALASLLILPSLSLIQRIRIVLSFKYIFWCFLFLNLVLIWLGSQLVETPFAEIRQVLTGLYFVCIFIILIINLIVKILF